MKSLCELLVNENYYSKPEQTMIVHEYAQNNSDINMGLITCNLDTIRKDKNIKR